MIVIDEWVQIRFCTNCETPYCRTSFGWQMTVSLFTVITNASTCWVEIFVDRPYFEKKVVFSNIVYNVEREFLFSQNEKSLIFSDIIFIPIECITTSFATSVIFFVSNYDEESNRPFEKGRFFLHIPSLFIFFFVLFLYYKLTMAQNRIVYVRVVILFRNYNFYHLISIQWWAWRWW
jgi:hypothetical protein